MGRCPHCEQRVKKYRRKLHKPMWHALKHIAAKHADGADHHDIFVNTYCFDVSKLRHWGLIDYNEKGNWTATKKGYDFLYHNLPIPKYFYMYNAKLFGFSPEMVTSKQCREKFDLKEAMDTAA